MWLLQALGFWILVQFEHLWGTVKQGVSRKARTLPLNFFIYDYLLFGQVLLLKTQTEMCEKWCNIDINIKKVFVLHFLFYLVKKLVWLRHLLNFYFFLVFPPYKNHYQGVEHFQSVWQSKSILHISFEIYIRKFHKSDSNCSLKFNIQLAGNCR